VTHAPAISVPQAQKKSWFAGKTTALLTGLGVFILIVLGISAVVIVQQQQERTARQEQLTMERQEEAERKAAKEQEYREAVVREMTDDIGKKVFRKMNREMGLGRYSGSDLDNWDYHPVKDRYVLDLTVNWEGKISGDDYWVEARAYVPCDYLTENNSGADVTFEIRSKSDSLISWEKTIGGIAIGVGIIGVLSR